MVGVYNRYSLAGLRMLSMVLKTNLSLSIHLTWLYNISVCAQESLEACASLYPYIFAACVCVLLHYLCIWKVFLSHASSTPVHLYVRADHSSYCPQRWLINNAQPWEQQLAVHSHTLTHTRWKYWLTVRKHYCCRLTKNQLFSYFFNSWKIHMSHVHHYHQSDMQYNVTPSHKKVQMLVVTHIKTWNNDGQSLLPSTVSRIWALPSCVSEIVCSQRLHIIHTKQNESLRQYSPLPITSRTVSMEFSSCSFVRYQII